MLYLFVDSAELCVLVEQQQFLLVSGGDRQTLSDQSDLLLRGQQSVTYGTHLLCPPAHKHSNTQVKRMCAKNKFKMKNTRGAFPLISERMYAHKNVRVLLNTHSRRVHLQRIE